MRSQECKTGRFFKSHRRSGGPRDRTGFCSRQAKLARQQYLHRYWYNNSPRRVRCGERCAGACGTKHSSAARRVLPFSSSRPRARLYEARKRRERRERDHARPLQALRKGSIVLTLGRSRTLKVRHTLEKKKKVQKQKVHCDQSCAALVVDTGFICVSPGLTQSQELERLLFEKSQQRGGSRSAQKRRELGGAPQCGTPSPACLLRPFTVGSHVTFSHSLSHYSVSNFFFFFFFFPSYIYFLARAILPRQAKFASRAIPRKIAHPSTKSRRLVCVVSVHWICWVGCGWVVGWCALICWLVSAERRKGQGEAKQTFFLICLVWHRHRHSAASNKKNTSSALPVGLLVFPPSLSLHSASTQIVACSKRCDARNDDDAHAWLQN